MTSIKIQRLPHSAGLDLPFYATCGSAGMDLLAAIDGEAIIKAGMRTVVPTGLCIALPEGYEAQIRPRSGLAAKYGITVLNTPGTIDSDYRGELQVLLINHGQEDFIVTRGMRIAQMIIAQYEQVEMQEVESLNDTVRGAGGFGSTGH